MPLSAWREHCVFGNVWHLPQKNTGFSGLLLPHNLNSIAQMTFRVLVNNHDRYVVDKNRIQADSGTIRAIHGFPQTGTHKDTPASMTPLVLSLLLIGRLIMALSERKPQLFRVFLKGVLRSERFHSWPVQEFMRFLFLRVDQPAHPWQC